MGFWDIFPNRTESRVLGIVLSVILAGIFIANIVYYGRIINDNSCSAVSTKQAKNMRNINWILLLIVLAYGILTAITFWTRKQPPKTKIIELDDLTKTE